MEDICTLFKPWFYRREPNTRKIRNLNGAVSYNSVPLQDYTKMQKFFILCITVCEYFLIISFLLRIIGVSNYYADNVYDNGFADVLATGVFDSSNGVNQSASSFFKNICSLVFQIALPFMSYFALGMTTLSLICSVIYLTKPDTFDEIDELSRARMQKMAGGGGFFKNLQEYYKSTSIRDFIYSLCPNIKAYAYQDAVAHNVNGPATMQDFAHTIPKYICIFAFCISLNNRAILDFIMNGARMGSMLFQRITYDYDYAEILNSILDEGRDYTPKNWDTKTPEGAHKLALYKSIYNKLKSRITDESQRTTASKTQMGVQLANDIESGVICGGAPYEKDIFKIQCEFVATAQDVSSIDGAYMIPVSQYVSGGEGFIYVYASGENQRKRDILQSSQTTTYTSGWGESEQNGKKHIRFSLSTLAGQNNSIPAGSQIKGASGTCTWTYADGTTETVNATYNNGVVGSTATKDTPLSAKFSLKVKVKPNNSDKEKEVDVSDIYKNFGSVVVDKTKTGN